MTFWKRTAIAVCAISVLFAAAPLRAEGPAVGHYLVEVVGAETADDVSVVAAALARSYGGRLEIYAKSDFHGFAITMTAESARELAADPRVKAVRENGNAQRTPVRSTTIAAPPLTIRPDSTSGWTTGGYVYDGAGNVVQIGTATAPNTEGRPNYYLYDARGRLVEGTANTATQTNKQTYTYDPFGNMTKVVTNDTSATSFGVDPLTNQIDKPENCVSGATCVSGTFDAAGNQITSNAGYTYGFDALNTMSDLRGPQNRHEVYLYDDTGERVASVSETAANQTWRYTLRGEDNRVWRELDDVVTGSSHSWSWVQDYVYRGDVLLATYKSSGGADVIQHFHLDHLGTPRLVTDDLGRQLFARTYLPYGQEAPGSSFDADVMKFTGHERDSATDGSVNSLDYMHARYYSSVAARFLTIDSSSDSVFTSEPDSWNRYAYGLGSPIKFTDPTGEVIYIIMYTIGNSHGDPDFEAAARTRAAEIEARKDFDPKKDLVLLVGVKTKAEATDVLSFAGALESQFGKVRELSVFSHADTPNNPFSSDPRGPYFHDGWTGQGVQWTAEEIKKLPINWEPGAAAFFWGCRTGWSFAQKFATAQHVTTYGQAGWSNVSGNPNKFEPRKPGGPAYYITISNYHNFAINPLAPLIKLSGAPRYAYPMVKATP